MNALRNLYIPKRIIVLGLCALAISINYADRSNIVVAIVYMAKEFDWSSTTQGLVLSAFFVGYLTTQVLGGMLADKFGGKLVLGIAAAGWTTFTLLTPSAAKLGLSYLLSCRILLGAAEGACYPSAHSLIASWAPPEERSRAVAIVSNSYAVGTVIALPLSTWLGSGPWGWESIFWVFGAAGVVWSVMWQIYGGSDPSTYSGISKEELDFILKNNQKSASKNYHSLPSEEINRNNESAIDFTEHDNLLSGRNHEVKKNSNPSFIPWGIIFSRREVWAIIVGYFCQSWGFFIMITWLPTYYLDHFKVDVKYLGYFAVLPYIAQGIFGFFVGALADYAIHKFKVRVIIVRRTAQIISNWGLAIFLFFAVYLAETPLQGITLITIGFALHSFMFAGLIVSQLDIAPRYSGVVFALGNTAGILGANIGVALTGWILDVTERNWYIVWNSVIILCFIGSSVFSFLVGEKVVIE